MTDFPDLKIKAIISFPASIVDGIGVDHVRTNGSYQFNIAFDDFAPPVGVIPDLAHQNALLWNSVTGAYTLVTASTLGSGGYVPEAPNDGVQYGRIDMTWTPIAGGGGGGSTPSNVNPAMDGAASPGISGLYSRGDHVHPSDTSKADVASLGETIDDRVAGLLVAGSNITLTYDDPGNKLTINSTASGGGSSNFIQGGTGAVTRTMQDKVRESISVIDFGAVGNGTTDDTTAIQAAINYAGSIGGARVLFPAGSYRIITTINIPGDNVCLESRLRCNHPLGFVLRRWRCAVFYRQLFRVEGP